MKLQATICAEKLMSQVMVMGALFITVGSAYALINVL